MSKFTKVPYSKYAPAPLVSSSTATVSRDVRLLPCNLSGTYSHIGQTQYPSTISWDISDGQSFINLDELTIRFQFKPDFYRNGTISYAKGYGPQLDQDAHALIARVRIGTSDTQIWEDLQYYGLWCNMNACYSDSLQKRCYSASDFSNRNTVFDSVDLLSSEDALDNSVPLMSNRSKLSEPAAEVTISSVQRTNSDAQNVRNAKRYVFLKLKLASTKSIGMFPLFLSRTPLRLSIDLQHPVRAFYNNYLGVPPQWKIEINALAVRALGQLGSFQTPMALILKGENNPFGVHGALTTDAADGVPDWTFTGGNANADKITAWTQQSARRWVCKFYKNGRPVICLQNGVEHPYYYVRSVSYVGSAGVLTNLSADSDATKEGDLAFLIDSPYRTGTTATTIAPLFSSTTTASKCPTHWPLAGGCPGLNSAMASTGWTRQQFIDMVDEMAIWEIPPNYNDNSGAASARTPTLVPHARITNYTDPSWNYSVDNPQMRAVFYKPSAEVYAYWRQKALTPEGLQWTFLHQAVTTYTVPNGLDQIVNIALNWNYRSLRTLYLVITDPATHHITSDNSSLNLPCLSSFMRRGLKSARVMMGGKQIPGYSLEFYSDLPTDSLPMMDEALGNESSRTIVGNFNYGKLMLNSRDYLSVTGAGPVQAPVALAPAATSTAEIASGSGYTAAGPYDNAFKPSTTYVETDAAGVVTHYRDASRFILGFSLMKHLNGEMVGLDTSTGGQLNVELAFGSHCDVRPRLIYLFGLADKTLTMNAESGTIVRV